MSVFMSKDKKELIVTCNCKCGQSFHITVDDEDRDSDIMFYLCYMKNNFDTEYVMVMNCLPRCIPTKLASSVFRLTMIQRGI